MQPAPLSPSFPAVPPAIAPGASPIAVEWTPNRLRQRSIFTGILFLTIAAFNLWLIVILLSAGRTPSIIVSVLTPLFLIQGALPFVQRPRIPIATGTSWAGVHFDMASGTEAHPAQSIAKAAVKFSLGSGMSLVVKLLDGQVFKYHGLLGMRARELKQFVERRQVESAAPMWAMPAGATPPMTVARAVGAPAAASVGFAPRADASPTAAWNLSELSEGRVLLDRTIADARRTGTLQPGAWISADAAFLLRQANWISAVLVVFAVLMTLNIGQRGRLDLPLSLGIGLGIGAGLAVAAQVAMRRTTRGTEGKAVMMLPPVLTSETGVEAMVGNAMQRAGRKLGPKSAKKAGLSWAAPPGIEVKASRASDGQVKTLVITTKGKENLEAHRKFKGAVLEAIGTAAGPSPQPTQPFSAPAPPSP